MNRFEEDDYEFADWNPDFDVFPPDTMHEEGEYTGRPIAESDTRVGETHHADCPSVFDPTWECCKALWEAEYQKKQEQELEDLHQEWWQ